MSICPLPPTFTMARLGTVWPAMALRFDAFGGAAPEGNTVRWVAALGAMAVTFTTTADTPEEGTPPRSRTATDRVDWPAMAPPASDRPSIVVPPGLVSASRA